MARHGHALRAEHRVGGRGDEPGEETIRPGPADFGLDAVDLFLDLRPSLRLIDGARHELPIRLEAAPIAGDIGREDERPPHGRERIDEEGKRFVLREDGDVRVAREPAHVVNTLPAISEVREDRKAEGLLAIDGPDE